MGRLFWKFFFAFFAAQLVASLAVGYAVSLAHDRQWREPPGLLDRPPPQPPSDRAGAEPGAQPSPPQPPGGVGTPPPPRPPREGFPLPLLPVIAGLLGSLIGSALLAWYFSRPIRHLRWALGEIAEGRFDTRVQKLMDGRRDELSDLGRDVDTTAQKLDRLITSQRRLLHDVSHELRSPLARIQAAIGLAHLDTSRVQAVLERVERETNRLDVLVGGLLAMARLEAGTISEQPTMMDVFGLLVDIVADARFEAQAGQREVSLRGDVVFEMSCRQELLHRAFENVLRNAVKYSVPGTVVEVEAAVARPDLLRITVCDRGPGVAPSELPRIFEPFHRGAGSDNDGFGLGLAIARRAIEAHGGSIHAENREGGGLCIVIELPRR